MQPVALLSQEARRINHSNLDLRLPVPATQDEISDLSWTLNEMLERIANAFETVRAFTGNASHELRTPIALLRTEIEVALIRPRNGDEYRIILSHLHQEAVRMTNLVENLLSIARADTDLERVMLQAIDLNDLFQRLARDWRETMHLAGIDFKADIGNEHFAVLGDPSTLPRLMTILLENARKYTPPGGSVSLSAKCVDAGIQIAVQDTGIGISENDMPRIFDRFFRGERAAIVDSSGSGLGLALGKWIAHRHTTDLVVGSSPGQGSTFSFILLRTVPPSLKERSLFAPNLLEDAESIRV